MTQYSQPPRCDMLTVPCTLRILTLHPHAGSAVLMLLELKDTEILNRG